MHTLVAQPELLGDLPQQRTGRVEAPDGVLVADPDLVGFVVEVEGLVPRLAGLPKDLPVKLVDESCCSQVPLFRRVCDSIRADGK